jgi:hypothetical protein
MEVNEMLREIYKNYSEEEKRILIDGTLKNLLDKREIQKFKELIAKNLEIEGEKLKKSGEEIPIEGYISFLSLAKNEVWEKSPLEKSLEILQQKNLKKCYILATPETIEDAYKVRKKLKNGQRRDVRYDVEVIEVETEDYEKLYNKLEKIVESSGISHDKFIIDNTLGFKMIMGVFYKFAVEQGVRLISWQSRQYSDNGRLYRIPAADKLNFIEFPQMKNFKLITKLNQLIEDFKFEEAMSLCEAINNSDRKLLLKKLSKIFTMETMLRIGSFGDEIVDNFGKKVIKGGKLEELEVELNDLFKRVSKEEERREKLYSIFHLCLSYNFFKGYFNENLNSKGRFEEVVEQEFYENLDELELNVSQDWQRNFDGMLEENILEDEIDDVMDYLDEFKELQKKLKIDLPRQIELEETTLNLKKIGVKFELEKKIIGKNSKNHIFIRKLINSPNYRLDVEEINELFTGEENEKIEHIDYYRLRDGIKKFNNEIKKYFKENSLDIEEDLIVLPDKELKLLKEIKISDFYML